MKPALLLPRAAGCALLPLLAVASVPAAAQATPAPGRWHAKPGTLIYLDGRPSTEAAINQVPDAAVACVEGLTGKPGVLRLFGDTVATRALVLTTKAHATSPATLALADRAHLPSAYARAPATVRDIAPRALAYITAHYPQAWLDGQVQRLTRKSTGEVKYQVRLADNWGWHYASFTAEGDFVNDIIN